MPTPTTTIDQTTTIGDLQRVMAERNVLASAQLTPLGMFAAIVTGKSTGISGRGMAGTLGAAMGLAVTDYDEALAQLTSLDPPTSH